MKFRKHGWIWTPLFLVVWILAGLALSGGLGRVASRNGTFVSIAVPVYHTWDAIRAAAVEKYRTRIKDPGTIRDYMKSHAVRKLQIGAGGYDAEGWLNSDIEPNSQEIYLDATGRYPFPDGSFQYVFSEHMIEHVPWEAGVAMLRECHRVLAPGGKVRTVTPNLAKFVQLLGGANSPADREFIDAKLRYSGWPVTPVTGAYILNQQIRNWGHQFLYDPATLRKTLEVAGFRQITEYPIGQQTDPVFQEAEVRTRNPGSDSWVVNTWEAMALEATR